MPKLISRRKLKWEFHLPPSAVRWWHQILGLSKYVRITGPNHSRLRCPVLNCARPVTAEVAVAVIKPFLKRIWFVFFCLPSSCLIITSVSSSDQSDRVPDLRMSESKVQKQNGKSEALALKRVKSPHAGSSVHLFLARLLEFCATLLCGLWWAAFQAAVEVCTVLYSWPEELSLL